MTDTQGMGGGGQSLREEKALVRFFFFKTKSIGKPTQSQQVVTSL